MSSRKARDDIIMYFESLDSRRFAEAEKAIKAIREKRFGDADFTEGYTKALEGILASIRTGDERDFLNKAPFDVNNMKRYKKSFREFVTNGVHSQFDVGYFMAWSDMVQYRIDNKKA